MNSSERQRQLKKRLFVLAGYLVITACLLVYLSYSSYRIKIESSVIMPNTYTIHASLADTYTVEDPSSPGAINQAARAISTSEAAVYLDSYNALVGLAPGTEAKTYALTSVPEVAQQHKFEIKVTNKDNDESTPSALDLYYTIEVETSGRLPLTFVIKEDGAVTASAVVDCTSDGTTTKAIFTVTNGTMPAVFKLDGTDRMKAASKSAIEIALGSTNEHEIYIGWNDSSSRANDIDLCREVDKITIRAKIYAAAPTFSTSETAPNKTVTYEMEELTQ